MVRENNTLVPGIDGHQQSEFILLSLAQDMATIRDRNDLFRIFYQKLQPVFLFDDAIVNLVDGTGKYNYYLFSYTSQDRLKTSPFYQQLLNGRHLIKGSPVEEVFSYTKPEIVDLQRWAKKYSDFVGIKIVQDRGYRQSAYLPLYNGNKFLGALEFHGKNQDQFREEQVPLFKAVANQIAVAVANILANEEILEREREKTLLLSVSEEIAKIRNTETLFEVMYQKVQPLTGADFVVISTLDGNQQTLRHLNGQGDERWQAALQEQKFIGTEGMSYPLKGSVTEYIYSLPEGSLYSLPELASRFDDLPIEACSRLGLVSSFMLKLNHRGEQIGDISFHATSKERFQNRNLPLLRSLADQVAVAVANILANEEITTLAEERRQRAEELQRTNEAVQRSMKRLSSEASPDAFVVQLHKELCELLGGEVTAQFRLGDEIITGATLVDYGEVILGDTLAVTIRFEEVPAWKQLHEDRLIQLYLDKDERLINKFTANFMRERGLRWLINLPLFVRERPAWVVAVLGKDDTKLTERNLELFRQLSRQLTLALELKQLADEAKETAIIKEQEKAAQQRASELQQVNDALLKANEEIQEQEREKTMLLQITEAIAKVQDREQLFNFVVNKLQPFFGADRSTFLLTYEAPKRVFHYFFSTVTANDVSKKAASAFWPSVPAQGLFGNLVNMKQGSIQPFAFFESQAADNLLNQTLLAEMQRMNIQQVMVAPLWCRGEFVGTLHVHSSQPDAFSSKQLPLFQAVADQLAVVVVNIKKVEEAQAQEAEKQLQLSIINHLNSPAPWEQRFEAIARELQPHLPFGFIYFNVEREQPVYGYAYLRTGKNEYQFVNKDHFLRITHLDEMRFARLLLPVSKKQKRVLNEADFKNGAQQHPMVAAVGESLGMKSNVASVQPLTHYGTFFISVFHQDGKAYTEASLALLENVFGGVAATLEKNLHADEIARLKEKLEQEKIYLADEIKSTYNFDEIIGSSQDMQDVYNKVNQVAKTDVTVLITGETGTGKELIARATHNYSNRKKNVMIKVNCAALPAQLVESELFGHEKGAFTGAVDKRVGKFEIANGSTIFLDEIGELPLELQAKLLRVLQEKEFERLGSNRVIKTDVRILAATNRNLEKEVAEGRFRSDLYYRLAVFPIELPPLRDRKDDIPLLAAHFIEKYNRKFFKNIGGLSTSVLQELLSSKWPGNIRELEHVLERAIMLTSGKMITSLFPAKRTLEHGTVVLEQKSPKSLAEKEKEHILETLKLTKGKIRGAGGAAALLEVKPTTLEARMKKLGIAKNFT